MARTFILAVVAIVLVAATSEAQQTTVKQTPLPAVGSMAPDFTLPGATRFGLLQKPVSLSDFRGKTVVISFFPRARTSGCTAQMETYRDQYGTLFNNGRDVIAISISSDADTTLASWARDAEFPILFASDRGGTVQGAYGSFDSGRLDTRALFVVGPDGRIAHVTERFNPMAGVSYTDLAAVIDSISPSRPDGGR